MLLMYTNTIKYTSKMFEARSWKALNHDISGIQVQNITSQVLNNTLEHNTIHHDMIIQWLPAEQHSETRARNTDRKMHTNHAKYRRNIKKCKKTILELHARFVPMFMQKRSELWNSLHELRACSMTHVVPQKVLLFRQVQLLYIIPHYSYEQTYACNYFTPEYSLRLHIRELDTRTYVC